MHNTNTSDEKRQRQKRPKKEEVEEQKLFLLEEESNILSEKASLGFGDVSHEEFLKMDPDLSQDQASVSRFIDVQERLEKIAEQKMKLFAEDIVIDKLNKKHAAVHTDRFYILTEKEDPNRGGLNFTLESRQSFRDTYENQIIQLPTGRRCSKADIWLKSEKRRQYDGIVFNPCLDEDNPRYFNIWKGFAVEAHQGSCEKYKDHVRNIICSDNLTYFNFLWRWCARLVQKPHKLGEVAPVLLGEPGTGKNTFVDALGKIFGGHYLPLDNIDQLLGKFNFHLKNAVLIHGNEALWGGNRKEGGKLKATITEHNKVIEGKGKDTIIVPNFTHLILSSNEDWPVHLDRDDRRFFVLKVSSQRKEDKAYFKAIHDELEQGGFEALLYQLLHEDISNFNHRELPQTDEALGIKLMSAPSSEKYVFEALKVGCFDIGNTSPTESWPEEKLKTSIYADYRAWCENEGESRLSNEKLRTALNRIIPSVQTVRPGNKGENRPRYYQFPELNQARSEFQKAYKVSSSVWEN